MRLLSLLLAGATLAAGPHAPQAPQHPDISVFFQATSAENDVADAALEQLAASWRDGYATMIVDLATLLAPSDYGRRRGDTGLAAITGGGDPFDTSDVRRNVGSLRPTAAVEPSSLIRRRIIRFLARQTGRDIPDDLTRWRDWIWDQPYEPHPDYAVFKGVVYGLIDERMREFFPPGAPHEIRLDEIVWGGVGVNGIPPLDHPQRVEAALAEYLDDDDIVFGIALNGEARAYPKRIIAWHELVRDAIGGVELTIVYCTLCGTVIPYGSVVEGRQITLGTSGLLYRSNKLMFDDSTNSLWSTLVGAPVVGPLVGSGLELDMYPVVTTTWGEWRASHPESTVLSLRTGYDRDYAEGAAYRQYFATDRLMFHVPELDDRLKNKAEILAIRWPVPPSGVRPAPLAIAAAFLVDNPVYQVERHGNSVVVVTSPEGANRVFEAPGIRFKPGLDGDAIVDETGLRWRVSADALVAESDAPGRLRRLPRLAAHRAFWFGWQAQFPDTELIK